jgi:hypothetical protein
VLLVPAVGPVGAQRLLAPSARQKWWLSLVQCQRSAALETVVSPWCHRDANPPTLCTTTLLLVLLSLSAALPFRPSVLAPDGYRPSWDTCASLAVEAARVARIAGDNPLATRVLAAMRACEAWMQEALQLLDTPEARAAVRALSCAP